MKVFKSKVLFKAVVKETIYSNYTAKVPTKRFVVEKL